MAAPKENPLLHQAISLAQSGRVKDAHALLHKITGENPSEEMAWLWLVQTEPDHEQRIQILEECLRHNPQSEYARKGLAGLRTGPLTGRPPSKPPSADRPKKGAEPRKRSSCRWKALLLLAALASGGGLIIAGILFYPQWKGFLPSLGLPEDPLAFLQAPAGNSPTPTWTSTLAESAVSITASRTNTPSATRTQTRTLTPSLTKTPTVTQSPTLFQGIPEDDGPAILFLAAGRCEVMRIPISGGIPESLTRQIPAECGNPEISPDGKKLAFIPSPDGKTIQTVNTDGSWKRQAAKLPANTGSGRKIWTLEWSPDGQQIAFVASGFSKDPQGTIQVHDSYGFLYTADVSTGYSKQMKALGVGDALSKSITWSPDGEWIFSFDLGNPQDMLPFPYAFRALDSRTVWVSHESADLGRFDWSPDSLYLSSLLPMKPESNALPADAPVDQYYIIISGLDETKYYIPLAEKDFSVPFGARWFPDRSAFLLFSERSASLVAVSKEGAVLNSVAILEKAPAFLSWSRDGQWIAIVEPELSDGAGGTLMIVHPDGADLRVLARGVGVGPLVWI